MEDLFQEVRETESLPTLNLQSIFEKYNRLCGQVQDNEIDSQFVYLELKQLKDFAEISMENIASKVIEDSAESPEKFGYSFRVSSKTTYKYDHIRDYAEKKQELEKLTDFLKSATILALKSGQTEIVDLSTGEVHPLAEGVRSAPFLIITKKK